MKQARDLRARAGERYMAASVPQRRGIVAAVLGGMLLSAVTVGGVIIPTTPEKDTTPVGQPVTNAPPGSAPAQAAPRTTGGDAKLIEFTLTAAQDTPVSATENTVPSNVAVLFIELTQPAGTPASSTSDPIVQTRLTDGTWCDVAHFNTITGVATRLMQIVVKGVAATDDERACTDGTLAAGTVNHGPIGEKVRVYQQPLPAAMSGVRVRIWATD